MAALVVVFAAIGERTLRKMALQVGRVPAQKIASRGRSCPPEIFRRVLECGEADKTIRKAVRADSIITALGLKR